MIKFRATVISKFKNYEYENNERWGIFLRIYFFIFENKIVKFQKFVIFLLGKW